MNDFLFWQSWSSEGKRWFYVLGAFFFGALLFLLISNHLGYALSMDWEVVSQKSMIPIPLDSFTVGPFEFAVITDNYIITEGFQGGAIKISPVLANLVMAFLVLVFTVCVAISTTFERFWFYASMLLVALLLVSFKFEVLAIGGFVNQAPNLIIIALYLALAFYFNSFQTDATLSKRVYAFSGLAGILGLTIFYFAQAPLPFMLMLANSTVSLVILASVFILMIAHEIVNAFLFMITKANTGSSKNTLRHFGAINLLYFAYIIGAYLKHINVIDEEIFQLNPFWLLGISGVIGLWGLKLRHSQIQNALRSYPLAVLFYLGWGGIAFLFMAYTHTVGNDALVKVFSDVILYSHIGFGFIFITYLIANFSDLLASNQKVYKVVYQPLSMPYFTYRLAGLIFVAALFLKENYEVPIYHSAATYYNNLADYYSVTGDDALSKSYYNVGEQYGYKNHKSNYQLGFLESTAKDKNLALEYYRDATEKRPSPFAFVNISNLERQSGNFFESMFALDQAKEWFPNNAEISNNLALIYGQTEILDSAIFYLNKSLDGGNPNNVPVTNMLALAARKGIDLNMDLFDSEDLNQRSARINLIAKNNKIGEDQPTPYLIPEDSVLNMFSSSLLINSLTANKGTLDTTLIRNIQDILAHGQNAFYREQVLASMAMHSFYAANIPFALRNIDYLASSSQEAAEYLNILGLWMLNKEAYKEASRFFSQAAERNHPDADFNLAIALSTRAGLRDSAIAVWSRLSDHGTDPIKEVAGKVIGILNNAKPFALDNDFDRYQYIFFNRGKLTIKNSVELLTQLEDLEIRVAASADLLEYWLEQDKVDLAKQLMNSLYPNNDVHPTIAFIKLRVAEISGDPNLTSIMALFSQKYGFNENLDNNMLFSALMETDSARSTMKYSQMRNSDPFDERAIISASHYFYNDSAAFESYNIIVEALDFNPNSPALLKEAALSSLKLGLDSYSDTWLSRLKDEIEGERFSDFVKQIDKAKTELEQLREEELTLLEEQ